METELSCTVDALPGLVWAAFPDGRTEFVNRRWGDYTGLSVEQESGEGWLAAFHRDDRPALTRAMAEKGRSYQMRASRRNQRDGLHALESFAGPIS